MDPYGYLYRDQLILLSGEGLSTTDSLTDILAGKLIALSIVEQPSKFSLLR